MKKTFDKLVKEITDLASGTNYIFYTIILFFIGASSLATSLIIAYAITFIINSLIRLIYYRKRPIEIKYKDLFERVYVSGSFPSNHATNVGLMLVIFTKYFNELYFTLFLALFAIIIMSSRIYLKKHHLTDLIAGFLIGVIIGVLVP